MMRIDPRPPRRRARAGVGVGCASRRCPPPPAPRRRHPRPPQFLRVREAGVGGIVAESAQVARGRDAGAAGDGGAARAGAGIAEMRSPPPPADGLVEGCGLRANQPTSGSADGSGTRSTSNRFLIVNCSC